MLESKPTIGPACIKSRALPLGILSVAGISTSTISPSSAAAHQCAQVAPTLPAPTIVIFARPIMWPPQKDAQSVAPSFSIGLEYELPPDGVKWGGVDSSETAPYRCQRSAEKTPKHNEARRRALGCGGLNQTFFYRPHGGFRS